MDTVNRSLPPHMVASQLKIFTPVGMPINILLAEKNILTVLPNPTANKWLQANATQAAQPTDSLAMKGKQLFQAYTCANCHSIRGTEANAIVGPDLTHVGSRQYLLTGLLKTNEDNLFEWINHPQQVKPGAYMPNFILNKDSVRALAHYLEQLK